MRVTFNKDTKGNREMANFKKTAIVALLAVGIGFTGISQASLIDRGNGLLYDDVLNVTWLQDANYAATSGYTGANSSGKMDWTTATTWAANLIYGGYNDWRMASNSPINGSSFNYIYAVNGTTDYGYNIASIYSELAYMYHVNLGLKDYYDTAGNAQNDYGIFGNSTFNGVNQNSYGQNNVGLVHNLQSSVYWSGSEYAPNLDLAWGFNALDGGQANYGYKGDMVSARDVFYAWAVRPGDVAAVPVPGAVWLFGSCLIGLLSFNRRKNKTANVIAA